MIPTLALGGLGLVTRGGGGGSTDPTARYWRIYMTATNGDSIYCFQEVEIRGSVGGSDLTSPFSTCAASSTLGSPFFPSEAVDNNTTDDQQVWASATGSPQWWSVDLGSAQLVAEVAIMPQNNGSFGPGRAPQDFLIQRSDDNANWDTIKTVTGSTGWTAGTYRTFSIP